MDLHQNTLHNGLFPIAVIKVYLVFTREPLSAYSVFRGDLDINVNSRDVSIPIVRKIRMWWSGE
jgi:hypothetical protein